MLYKSNHSIILFIYLLENHAHIRTIHNQNNHAIQGILKYINNRNNSVISFIYYIIIFCIYTCIYKAIYYAIMSTYYHHTLIFT